MNKRGGIKVLSLLTGIIILFAILHTTFQFVAFGTGLQNFYGKGISGLVVKNIDLGQEVRSRYSAYAPISKIFLIGEWSLILGLIIFGMFRSRLTIKRYVIPEKMRKNTDKSKIKTDLDVLYSMLQEKGSISLSAVSSMFNIDKETATEWCNILESGDLAELNYPKFGDPEIRIKNT
jgi:hypothetical protein